MGGTTFMDLYPELQRLISQALTNARMEERERIKRCMFPVIDIEAQSSEEQHE